MVGRRGPARHRDGRGRRSSRPRQQSAGSADGQGRAAEDRPEGQRHREDPAQDPGRDQRRREREDHEARRSWRASGVEKGALLVELDRERYLAAVESAEASVRSAQANAALVQREHGPDARRSSSARRSCSPAGSSRSPRSRRSRPQYQVEVARHKSAHRSGRAGQGRAQAGARRPVQDHASTPPCPARSASSTRRQGEIALGSQFQKDVILVIADLSEMEAQVNVDENDIVSIARRPGGRDRGRRAARISCCRASSREIASSANVRRRRHRGAEDRVRDQDRASPSRPRRSARA